MLSLPDYIQSNKFKFWLDLCHLLWPHIAWRLKGARRHSFGAQFPVFISVVFLGPAEWHLGSGTYSYLDWTMESPRLSATTSEAFIHKVWMKKRACRKPHLSVGKMFIDIGGDLLCCLGWRLALWSSIPEQRRRTHVTFVICKQSACRSPLRPPHLLVSPFGH